MILRLLLLYVLGGQTESLKNALVDRPAEEIGKFFDELDDIRCRSFTNRLHHVFSITDVSSAMSFGIDQRPITGVRDVEAAALAVNVQPPVDEGRKAFQTFVTDVLCTLRLRFLDFRDALLLFNSESALLALLFPEPTDGLKSPPRHLRYFFTCLYYTQWPSLDDFDTQAAVALPDLWPINPAVEILKHGSDPAILNSVITHILNAIKETDRTAFANIPTEADIEHLQLLCPQLLLSWNPSRYLAQHYAAPFLWFALYLAFHSETAALLLAAGGLLHTLHEIDDRSFPDPREEIHMTHATYQRNLAQVYRLLYLLLRVMASQPAALVVRDGWGRAELYTLREKFRLRCLALARGEPR